MEAAKARPDAMEAQGATAELVEYLQAAYIQDSPLEPETINKWLSQIPPQALQWTSTTEDDLPPLHYACMNEATDPGQLYAAVSRLLEHGADPQAKDSDGDTALQAVLSLATQDEEPPDEEAAQAHYAVVRALIHCPKQELGEPELRSLCGWLRSRVPENGQKQVLTELERRVGREATARAWTSEMFMQYLEQSAYEEKRPLQASVVQQYLAAGACPSISQNGASALLLMVLNPYSSYEEMVPICRMVLQKSPQVVCQRDGFKLSPLDWASDYENIAAQHNVPPNPAALLALLPAVVELAPEMADASGARCLKVSASGITGEARPETSLRFLEGDRVRCRVEAPGGTTAWEEGTIVALWYRDKCWPRSFPGAPYEIKLDIGQLVYALSDNDVMIRSEAQKAPSAGLPTKVSGGRFCKRQREDGSWELLDTKSGKSRACSPPDSDED